MDAAARAAAAFRAVYGAPPAGLWSAPGRANLIGEHTDYNAGFVLPFALGQRTVVAAAPTTPTGEAPVWQVWSDRVGELVRFDEIHLRPGAVTGWGAYVAGVVWALRDAGHAVPGACLAVVSDVPPGAGLSSSAALEAAVLRALLDLAGLAPPLPEQVRLAWRAEAEFVGVPCGIMDQSAALRCRTGHALFLDCRSEDVAHVPFDPGTAGLALLVVDSRATHAHASGEYAARRRACADAAAALGVPTLRDVSPAALPAALRRLDDTLARRVRHVVTENQRVRDTVAALRAGEMRAIGPRLTASHLSMRDDFQVTAPEVDAAVEAALAAGALGARMTGGGFGGCVLVLVETAAVERTTAAVAAAFDHLGFRPPVAFPAEVGGGATRLAD
ncbi:MAG TPA: galactokinase [Pilimelia sp.]|nr:galactokinase [Pilimelia sp.]